MDFIVFKIYTNSYIKVKLYFTLWNHNGDNCFKSREKHYENTLELLTVLKLKLGFDCALIEL